MSALSAQAELTTLGQLVVTLTAHTQPDDIIAAALQGVHQLAPVERAAWLALAETLGEPRWRKTLSSDPTHTQELWANDPNADGLAGLCARAGQPLMFANPRAHPAFVESIDGVPDLALTTLLCVPVRRGQAPPLGVLMVYNPTAPLDDHALTVFTLLGAALANALHHAQVIQRLTSANMALENSRRELARSRQTLFALFDGLPQAIYIIDPAYRLVAVNRAQASLVHPPATPPQLVGRLCYTALYGRAAPCPDCRVHETLAAGQTTARVERRDLASGRREWELNTYPIHNDDGQVFCAIVLAHDVTEKRHLEESLVQAEKMAVLGQLAAGVAHDINNPLAAIIANTQLLRREALPNDDWRDSLDLIALAGERAQRVVRNLLDFARQETYDLYFIDPNDTLTSALALVQSQFHAANIALEVNLAQGLPLVQASSDHLQSVWLNLLLNARDALSGRPDPWVRVTSAERGGQVCITIQDNGAGIPPEKLGRIFEPFFTTKKAGLGTGLGLALCQRIVRQHHGEITVASAPEAGATFTVTLPGYFH